MKFSIIKGLLMQNFTDFDDELQFDTITVIHILRKILNKYRVIC
jgi:hypothetical protein